MRVRISVCICVCGRFSEMVSELNDNIDIYHALASRGLMRIKRTNRGVGGRYETWCEKTRREMHSQMN